ncbi:hypothetical protein DFJ43DRAFT_1149969 [Lentinula guzmanii]|uniref:Uncharacterized protein n=1 Tax=Lentinula guzmanii TaxID=2804957 RepID=A0AA38K195_9AGAR|nr:hypothetical protein DFJ43DRAFT_1149969 [Lentinula guzmanii]
MSWTTHQLATSDDTNGSDFHAVIDTDVFTCLSRRPHDFPRVPSRSDTVNPSPNAATLPNFYTPRWVTSSLPFLGFAPSSNPFKFYFLKCLDYDFHTLPIEQISENRYALKQSLQTDWDSLERNMRAFLRGFWRTEVDARRAAMCSRQAFIPLIACISFYLRLLYHLESKWVDIVAASSRAPFQEPSAFLSKRQQEYEDFVKNPLLQNGNGNSFFRRKRQSLLNGSPISIRLWIFQ